MTESNEAIQPFKLDDAAKQLREKIRLAFVELIPPEQWEAMVKAELDTFTKQRPNTRADQWNKEPGTLPSVFSEVATAEYREHVKALFKVELAKPEWGAEWDGYKQQIGKLVKEWLTENARALLQTTLKELLGYEALKELLGYEAQQMINRLRSGQ